MRENPGPSPASLALALAAALWVAACAAPTPDRVPPSPAASQVEREAYEAALRDRARDPASARAQLGGFLELYPGSPLADDAAVELARIEIQRGDDAAAERWLRFVVERHPKSDRADAARVLLAEQDLRRRDLSGASGQMRRVRLSLLRDDERHEAHRVLADLSAAEGDRATELHWLSRLRAGAGDAAEVAEIDTEIDAAIASLSPEQLEEVGRRLGRRVPAARTWLRLAALALASGDEDRADKAIDQLRKLPLTPDEAARLATLESGGPGALVRGDLPPRHGDLGKRHAAFDLPASGTIAVVLPFTGPLGWVSEETLRGVLLAAGIYGPAPPAALSEGASLQSEAGGVRVLVRDSSAGKPERAAAAVRELAARGDVAAVIGPLLAEETLAAAEAAQATGLPLLALTRRQTVASTRSYVFRIGLTREMEAEALAEHAIGTLGLERFAILYPRDPYGREFESLLWRSLEARGGRIVGASAYDPGANDFADPIRKLIGFSLLSVQERDQIKKRRRMLAKAKRLPPEAAAALREEAAALTGPGDSMLPPIVDFDALFIPDAHDKVALIAPQLAFHRIEGVRLLGASGWHDPDLLEIAGKHVDGAFFTSGFDADHSAAAVRDFAARYVAAYGEAPGRFAAQAFDAARIALSEMANGHAEPDALRGGLLSRGPYPGVSGVLQFDPDGNARRRPFLVGIRRGRTHPIE